MRNRVYDYLQRLSLRFYQERQTGELMSRTVNDTGNFEVLIAHAIPDTLTNLLMLIGVSIILFSLNAWLAALTLLPIPLLAYLAYTFAHRVRPAFRQMQERLAELNSALQDNFSGIKEIQAFTQEERESRHIGERAGRHASATIMSVRLNALYHPSTKCLPGSAR
jgi:ATP-binding cassette subfamily B protein